MRTRSHRKRQPSPGEDAQQLIRRAIRISWTTDEEAELLNFLQDRRRQMISGATFTVHLFDQAAEYIEIFRRRGAVKTGKVCKSKWVRLKRTHRLITLLKSKCGTAFEWDDETGMGVTAERQADWDDLVKGNKGFKAFANKGWPHCEAMQILIPTRAKGKHTYRDTQPASHISQNTPQASGPSPSDLEHKSSLFDDTAISETCASLCKEWRSDISEKTYLFHKTIKALAQLACALKEFAAIEPAAAGLVLVPTPAVKCIPYQIDAIQQLIQSVEESAIVDGAKWLSEDNTIRITNRFQKDLHTAIMYIKMRNLGGERELLSRKLVMWLLNEMDAEAYSSSSYS